ncbi:hypothetical protein KCU61_g211, partial [Aureobasidium melanogenum]
MSPGKSLILVTIFIEASLTLMNVGSTSPSSPAASSAAASHNDSTLVGMAVEETEDWLQFWQCVMGEIHDRRLIGIDHRHGSGAEAKEVSILGGLAGLLLKGSSEVWGLGSGVKLLDGVPHWVMNDITRERGIVLQGTFKTDTGCRRAGNRTSAELSDQTRSYNPRLGTSNRSSMTTGFCDGSKTRGEGTAAAAKSRSPNFRAFADVSLPSLPAVKDTDDTQ